MIMKSASVDAELVFQAIFKYNSIGVDVTDAFNTCLCKIVNNELSDNEIERITISTSKIYLPIVPSRSS
jgi:hypothetical protein